MEAKMVSLDALGERAYTLQTILKAQGRDGRLDKSTKVNEEELYAVNLYSYLTSKDKTLGTRFLELLPEAIKKSTEIHGSARVFNAADRVMRRLLKDGKIMHDEYQASRDYAFGMSQLDQNKKFLSRTESVALEEGMKIVSTNCAATSEAVGAYKRELQKIAKLQRTTAATNNSTVAGGSTHSSSSIAEGFLWKPESDSDGNLVILLPSNLVGKASGVRVLSPEGNVLAQGRYGGIANGFRQHFRFDRPGSAFPNNSIVEIQMANSENLRFKIANTSLRVE